MALNVSAWSIRQPLPSIVIMAAIVAIGFLSFQSMPITRMPNIDVPVISVIVTQFGASPAELETQVTKKIEDAVAGRRGRAPHHFPDHGRDREHHDRIPAGDRHRSRPQRRQGRGHAHPARSAAHHRRADGPARRHRRAADPHLCGDRARKDPGAALVVRARTWSCASCRECAAWPVSSASAASSARSASASIRFALQGVGVTALDVSRQLRGSNVDLAGGRAEIGGRDQAIRTLAGAKTIAELARDEDRACRAAARCGWTISASSPTPSPSRAPSPASMARPVVGFSILRAKGASDVVVAKLVERRIEQIKKDNPEVELKLIDSSVHLHARKL